MFVCFIFCLSLLRGFYNIILLAFSANPHSFIIAVNVLSTKKTLVTLFSRVAIFTCGRAFHSYYPEGKWGTTRSVWTSTFPVRDIYTRIYVLNEFSWALYLPAFVQDTKTFKTPTRPPPPSPTEVPQGDIFTVNQLLNLYRQVCKWILFLLMTTSPVTTVSCFLFTSRIFLCFFAVGENGSKWCHL